MMTFRQFASKPESIPASTSWYLADLGETRRKQELFTKQAPQKLKVLRENAMIESAVSSNRIEGVTVDQARVRTILFGRLPLRDRNELPSQLAGRRISISRLFASLRMRMTY